MQWAGTVAKGALPAQTCLPVTEARSAAADEPQQVPEPGLLVHLACFNKIQGSS